MLGVIYVVVAIVCWPIFALVTLRFFQQDFGSVNVDVVDYIAAAGIALCGALVWPLTILMAMMTFLLMRVTKRLDEIKREAKEARRETTLG